MTIRSNPQENRVDRISFFYSVIIAILPYLDYFPSRIFRGFTLSLTACVALVAISLIAMIRRREKLVGDKRDTLLIAFSIYICLTNIVSNIITPGISSVNGYFSTYSTAFFIINIVCFFNYKNWNDNIAHKAILIVSLIATAGVILQTITFYLFGTYLKLVPIEYMTESIQKQYFRLFTHSMEGLLFRPCSIFLEPSYYCEYVVCALVWCLYKTSRNNEIKWYLLSGFISLGMVLTTSGMGIFMVAVAWLLLLILNRKRHMQAGTFIFLLVAFVIVIIVVFRSNLIEQAIGRVYSVQTGLHSARFDDSRYFQDLGFFNKLFGIGYGREPDKVYFTNIICFAIRIGIFGIIFYGLSISNWIKSFDFYSKMFALIYIIIFITSGTYSFFYFVFYLSLIQSARYRVEQPD